MDFRRSAARRRRVMREDVLDVERSSETATSTTSPFQRYNTAEVLRAQPMMLDWFPKRVWTNLVSSLVMLLICSAVVAIHYQPVGASSVEVGSAQVASKWHSLLSLHETSSLGHLFWTSSAMTSVVLVYQLFLLRRHREDDYQGGYQVWLWTLPLSIVVALASVPSFRTMIGLTIETLLVGSQASFALASLLTILAGWATAMTFRLFVEIRESKFSAIVLVASALAGCSGLFMWAAVLFQLPLGPVSRLPSDSPLVLGFVATIGWHVSLLTYLGYVCRDVMGLVDHRELVDADIAVNETAGNLDNKKSGKTSKKKVQSVKEEKKLKHIEDCELSHEADSESTPAPRRTRRRSRRQAA